MPGKLQTLSSQQTPCLSFAITTLELLSSKYRFPPFAGEEDDPQDVLLALDRTATDWQSPHLPPPPLPVGWGGGSGSSMREDWGAGGMLLFSALQCPRSLRRGVNALQLVHPSAPWAPFSPSSTDLVHHQEVLYGFPIGKDHISSVLHGLRQDLLHLLSDDTWGEASQVCVRGEDCPQHRNVSRGWDR